MYKTIDLCAGIGGIRKGFEMTGKFKNVLSAEIDLNACKTYELLFGENPFNDLTSDDFKRKVSKRLMMFFWRVFRVKHLAEPDWKRDLTIAKKA